MIGAGCSAVIRVLAGVGALALYGAIVAVLAALYARIERRRPDA